MADLNGTIVEFPSNGSTARGYLSMPAGGSGRGVLVIQEWWGLVDQIKGVADRFAAAGYVALAPDMYHGETTTSPDDAGKLMMALNIERAEKDLRGAVDYLASQSTGDKVGVVGFCMGGQLALFAASKNDKVGACVDFYGIHPSVNLDFSSFKAPVLGLFAENDSFVTPRRGQYTRSEFESSRRRHGFSYLSRGRTRVLQRERRGLRRNRGDGRVGESPSVLRPAPLGFR